MRLVLAGVAAILLTGAALSPAQADCTCRARDVVATHGETVCIRTPDGFRLARCEKVSNIASWAFLETRCPQIALQPVMDAISDRGPAALEASLAR